MEQPMKNLRILSAAIALAAILPLAAPSASIAAERGPGACTTPAGDAVGADGPAMNGGQLMAARAYAPEAITVNPYYGAGSYYPRPDF
jgi:hypothetical protein